MDILCSTKAMDFYSSSSIKRFMFFVASQDRCR